VLNLAEIEDSEWLSFDLRTYGHLELGLTARDESSIRMRALCSKPPRTLSERRSAGVENASSGVRTSLFFQPKIFQEMGCSSRLIG
jgi:hypothetical protein